MPEENQLLYKDIRKDEHCTDEVEFCSSKMNIIQSELRESSTLTKRATILVNKRIKKTPIALSKLYPNHRQSW